MFLAPKRCLQGTKIFLLPKKDGYHAQKYLFCARNIFPRSAKIFAAPKRYFLNRSFPCPKKYFESPKESFLPPKDVWARMV